VEERYGKRRHHVAVFRVTSLRFRMDGDKSTYAGENRYQEVTSPLFYKLVC